MAQANVYVVRISYTFQKLAKQISTRHQIIHVNHYFSFIPTTYTNTRTFNLISRDFVSLYTLIYYNLTLDYYAQQTYPHLVDFYIRGICTKKKGI
jgi:hypothetical protein